MSATFILEFFSEEIPARLQQPARGQLEALLTEQLRCAGLPFSRLYCAASPRRLLAIVEGLPLQQDDSTLEKKGPRADATGAALEGFLNANGVTVADLEKRDTGKGVFYFLNRTVQGQPTTMVLTELVASVLQAFQWPKSMRWGGHRFRWIRPLQRITAVFDGKALPGGFFLGNSEQAEGYTTQGSGEVFLPYTASSSGHRLHAPEVFTVTSDVPNQLGERFVVVDTDERKTRIRAMGDALAAERGLVAEYPAALLEEVAGLVEWPVPVLGSIPPRFMELPPEVLMTSMRVHQKYFPCFEDSSGRLAPFFLAVANQETPDNGASVRHGNEKVLAARLFDAAFFWQQDQLQPLEQYNARLDTVVFHAKAGTTGDKVRRVTDIAAALAPHIAGADAALAQRAATLCKADLMTGMVGEFPELQGIMGSYYAERQGEKPEVVHAIRHHYQPQGPSQPVPVEPVAITVALADKLDSLCQLFAAGEAPTGSKDPFALRRLAYGIIRIVLENRLALDLLPFVENDTVQTFLRERLQQYLKDRDFPLAAIRAATGDDTGLNFLQGLQKTGALATFLATPAAETLLQHYSRASNIVRIEVKKDGMDVTAAVNPALFTDTAERELHEAVEALSASVDKALASEDFLGACNRLGTLGAPLEAFFDRILVNAPDVALRTNRLRLLQGVRTVMKRVANFEG